MFFEKFSPKNVLFEGKEANTEIINREFHQLLLISCGKSNYEILQDGSSVCLYTCGLYQ